MGIALSAFGRQDDALKEYAEAFQLNPALATVALRGCPQ